jgi:hypothetical protein
MRPPAAALRAERIGVLRGRLAGQPELAAFDPGGVRLGKQKVSVGVVADKPDRRHRHRGIEMTDIDREIARRAAATLFDGKNPHKPVLARPVFHQLVAIDAPRAAGDETPPAARHGYSVAASRSTRSVIARSSASGRAGVMRSRCNWP